MFLQQGNRDKANTQIMLLIQLRDDEFSCFYNVVCGIRPAVHTLHADFS